MGVTLLLVEVVRSIAGEFEVADHDASSSADALLFFRHVGLYGEMREAIGVLKKRTSDYERMLRELDISPHGVTVDDPLTEARWFPNGQPQIVDREG